MRVLWLHPCPDEGRTCFQVRMDEGAPASSGLVTRAAALSPGKKRISALSTNMRAQFVGNAEILRPDTNSMESLGTFLNAVREMVVGYFGDVGCPCRERARLSHQGSSTVPCQRLPATLRWPLKGSTSKAFVKCFQLGTGSPSHASSLSPSR